MAFPEFDNGSIRVLYFSRGKGRGHAIPDSGIIRALERTRPELQVRIVSYALGAEALQTLGHDIIDVGLPETSPIVEMSVIAGKLIRWLNPDVIVSHEEFAAIPAAAIFDRPAIAIVEWFTDDDLYSMNTLRFSEEILFTGQPDASREPSYLNGRVRYLPPVVRAFEYRPEDRQRARHELNLPEDATIIAVLPGSWREEQAPIAKKVAEAYDRLDLPEKRLIWIAGTDSELVSRAFAGRPDVRVLEVCWPMDRLMIAADVAITKTNRMSVYELDALGIRSIAITFGLNPMDDAAVSRLDGVLILSGADMDAGILLEGIRGQLADRVPRRKQTYITPQQCAPHLLAMIDRALAYVKDDG